MSEPVRVKSSRLAHALASGRSAAQAAASVGLTLDQVAPLMDDPIFLDMVAGWRGYLTAPEEDERLQHLYKVASAILRGAAAAGDPDAIAFWAEMDEHDDRGEGPGTLH